MTGDRSRWLTLEALFSIRSPTTIAFLEDDAAKAVNFQDWRSIQSEIESFQSRKDKAWFEDSRSPHYDWQTLQLHVSNLRALLESSDGRGLAGYIRILQTRNISRILSPQLYLRSPVRTKRLIHEYVQISASVLRHLSRRESVYGSPGNALTRVDRQQLFDNLRQSLGKTCLLLQGGSAFSLCHIGVARALLHQSLLPQVITAASTSAFVAALICTTAGSDLKMKLSEVALDCSAFDRARQDQARRKDEWWVSRLLPAGWWERITRLWRTGHLFDIAVIEECAKDNFADLTFAEAYTRTGRVLNITVTLAGVFGTPQLLNYITAPNVYIWSAIVASVSTSRSIYSPVSLYSKGHDGQQEEFYAPDFRKHPDTSPLDRIGELFDVNHFIISQARPYMIPFVKLSRPRIGIWGSLISTICIVILNELLHWLKVLDSLHLAPAFLSRIILDESIPASGPASKLHMIPDLNFWHLLRIFEYPTPRTMNDWATIGERSTWPHINELKMRCAVEFEVESVYQGMRRRPVHDIHITG